MSQRGLQLRTTEGGRQITALSSGEQREKLVPIDKDILTTYQAVSKERNYCTL
jgi:hypothetical protein